VADDRSEKRQIKRTIRQLQHVKTWQLFIVLILMIFVSATFLRLNNIGMEQRRTGVLQADKDGDQAVIQARLYDLQRYVTAHMNADMGTIYLEDTYKRDTQGAIDAASGTNNPNGNVFLKAQQVCAPKYAALGHYSLAYQQCVIDQLNSYPTGAQLTSNLQLPKADAYRHSYVSPLWSPDFAGFSVLICLLILLTIIARFLGILLLRAILKMRNRGL
jgi:hypothetical protein